MIVLSIIFLKPILRLLGATESVLPYAATYASIYIVYSPRANHPLDGWSFFLKFCDLPDIGHRGVFEGYQLCYRHQQGKALVNNNFVRTFLIADES